VIKSFRGTDTERLFRRESVRRFRAIERQALRKLDMLDAAEDLHTMGNLPGNRLQRLKAIGETRTASGSTINGGVLCGMKVTHIAWKSSTITRGLNAKKNKAGTSRGDSSRRVHGPVRTEHEQDGHDLRVPVTRIADIVNQKRGITADTALRFAHYFNNTPSFWMNLQTRYDLEVAEDEIAAKVERDVLPLQQSSTR
jgi:addiction module HigA family antidote